MSDLKPELIERAALEVNRHTYNITLALTPYCPCGWSSTDQYDVEGYDRHVAREALTTVADDLRAEGVTRGFRDAANLLDEMTPCPEDPIDPAATLRLAASVLRGLADVQEGAVQCPICAHNDAYAANEAAQREPEPDPMDADDYRDRVDNDGDVWRWGTPSWSDVEGWWTATGVGAQHGPMSSLGSICEYTCGDLWFAEEAGR